MDHKRRRHVEVQLAEMRDRLEDSGVPDEEIERRIATARANFLKQYERDEQHRIRQVKKKKEMCCLTISSKRHTTNVNSRCQVDCFGGASL